MRTKPRSASGLDQPHYPNEQPEVATRVGESRKGNGHSLDPAEVARRAYEIWIRKGRPEGSAERDWQEAEEQLKRALTPGSLAPQEDGSVQQS